MGQGATKMFRNCIPRRNSDPLESEVKSAPEQNHLAVTVDP